MKARHAAPLLVGALIVQRLLELRVARANERWARERGAVEYGQAHYPLFFVLHPAWLLATLLEGRRGGRVNWPALALLLLAQPLRYWVIRTLGRYWNTRILIVPGGERVTGGPFRYLKHPNYAVVALELAAAPLAVGAWRTALAFTLLNAALLLGVRIPAEEEALRAYARDHQSPEGATGAE
ncbi:isoprenylcysteine carboxyl methyltransferase family protein [Deinococcus arcticus]|uniref:Isoprenylcysteine carboxyl methyltransferase n=1 Tax=Deinococcus arcticus TaxID=2136176 RepID=A0A2T3WAK1_9DEIO|nr:isoprenylcysteine carboxylmethyltransferase family protein [Deinococcus arcticus]PTA68930.1 hypothetical protein C8263_03755 [Deinococcus arcticus]